MLAKTDPAAPGRARAGKRKNVESYFSLSGAALIDNGYRIVPIRPGEKRPAIQNWQSLSLSAKAFPAFSRRFPDAGVGLLTGQGDYPLCAIDIDTSDPTLAAAMVEWCDKELGPGVERIGKAPKRLLLYRAAEAGWHKAASGWYEDLVDGCHRLEVLGKGQQFVAFHIHPDTGEPYEWPGRSPLDLQAAELPVVTPDQIEDLLMAFEALALDAGLEPRARSLSTGLVSGEPAGIVPPLGISPDCAREILADLDPEDYETWIRVGMALHHEYRGAESALDLWDVWSSAAENYVNRFDLAKRWKDFGRHTGQPVTLRSFTKKERRARTEFGNAERMLDRFGAGLMFVPEQHQWYSWTGNHWRMATGVALEHAAKETIRGLPDEAEKIISAEERESFFKFCAASQRASMVQNMVRLAQSDPRVVVSARELDRFSYLLGVKNGAIDLSTGELLPASVQHRITRIAPVDYCPGADASLFRQTVSDVFFDNLEMVDFFQRVVGYALLGEPSEDVIVIPFGSGANGKSTILGAIRDTLGDYARTASAETFLSNGSGNTSSGSAREDILRLRGARFVYISEPDQGSELREGLIKSMTGGESLPARGLYAKSTIEVVPSWVSFMPTNHKPIIKGDDHAIWRRLLLIPFLRNFDRDTTIAKDVGRAEKLAAERAGILAWAVEGALAYQCRGLCPPASVQAARDEYRTDMDLLADWLSECCLLGDEYSDTSARLWDSWREFSASRGELRYISSSRILSRRLTDRGFQVRKSNGTKRLVGLQAKSVSAFFTNS